MPSNSNAAIREAALQYAAVGLSVLPIVPSGKAPLIENGVHAASTDTGQIEEWWDRWPHANLALACGERAGFDVLDVDRQHGGIETLNAFLSAHGALPPTPRQLTPSGGFHLLFRHEPGLKNWSGGQGTAPPGLDCRTTGAMIRVAPVTGYRWERFIDPGALSPWPEYLAAFFRPIGRPGRPPGERDIASRIPASGDNASRYLERALEGIAEEIASAPPGCQQTTLNACAFRAGRLLAAINHNAEDAKTALIAAGMRMMNEKTRQPWRRFEVQRIVERGIEDGLREGPAALPETLLEAER